MNREIKFRGKTATVDGQNWVYGHYTRVESFFNDKKKDYIEVIKNNHIQDYAVIEDTVGQYTGLKDKNGVEIYEGDIVKVYVHGEYVTGKIIYEHCGFTVDVMNNEELEYGRVNILETFVEVIGNIYDNPELLEKEGKVNE